MELLTNCKQLEVLNAKQCSGDWPKNLSIAPVQTLDNRQVSLRVLELQHFSVLDDASLQSICALTVATLSGAILCNSFLVVPCFTFRYRNQHQRLFDVDQRRRGGSRGSTESAPIGVQESPAN